MSIIDPVTINFEIGGRYNSSEMNLGGLNDIVEKKNVDRTAEIVLQQLNIRLSYRDWLMFKFILESFPKQFQINEKAEKEEKIPANVQTQINQLVNLGFKKEDCIRAIESNNGNLDNAAIWLTANADPIAGGIDEENPDKHDLFLDGSNISFSSLEIKTSSINFCIIDDCKDADVPLLELYLCSLNLKHGIQGTGEASYNISGSYYNRLLSSWEPFMEPWKCHFNWRREVNQKMILNLITSDIINVNITSSLLKLMKMVQQNWSNEVISREQLVKQRIPFVPYSIRNETGMDFMFSTLTKTTSGVTPKMRNISSSDLFFAEQNWIRVSAGETVPFSFYQIGKIRYLNSREVKIHQLIVRIDGWMEVSPVTVDVVGTYFRSATPSVNPPSGVQYPPARVVFKVSLEGSARKLVTVRSALLVSNKLHYSIQLKLENTAFKIDGKHSFLSSHNFVLLFNKIIIFYNVRK